MRRVAAMLAQSKPVINRKDMVIVLETAEGQDLMIHFASTTSPQLARMVAQIVHADMLKAASDGKLPIKTPRKTNSRQYFKESAGEAMQRELDRIVASQK